MRRLIISDIHLGSPCFVKKERLLYLLKKPWDEIIIAGDLYELLGFKTKKEIEDKYPEIFEILNRKNVIRIEGNHDIDCGLKDYFFTLPNKKVVAITHGNKYDNLTNPYTVKLNILLYDFFGFEIRRFLKIFKRYDECEKKLIEEYKSKCDFLIFGHTHNFWIKNNVYNTGDWIEHNSYIIIEDNDIFVIN